MAGVGVFNGVVLGAAVSPGVAQTFAALQQLPTFTPVTELAALISPEAAAASLASQDAAGVYLDGTRNGAASERVNPRNPNQLFAKSGVAALTMHDVELLINRCGTLALQGYDLTKTGYMADLVSTALGIIDTIGKREYPGLKELEKLLDIFDELDSHGHDVTDAIPVVQWILARSFSQSIYNRNRYGVKCLRLLGSYTITHSIPEGLVEHVRAYAELGKELGGKWGDPVLRDCNELARAKAQVILQNIAALSPAVQ